MAASAIVRAMHRVHRSVGSILALMVAVWFASGAVMAFAGFPELSEAERLALAPALPGGVAVSLAPALEAELVPGLADGARVRLAMLEGRPTWLATNAAAERIAQRADGGDTVARLSEARARAEAEQRFGLVARGCELVAEADQWTMVVAKPGVLPLWRVRFDDAAGTEAYLSARTGELVQASTRQERVLAWLGAIPHWVYFTFLRREREVWRYAVLAVAVVGLVVTVSGMIAGLHVYRATRKRKAPRDPYLRWHQHLGLWFGLLANTWLVSGALSLVPFDWSGPRGPSAREQAALFGVPERARRVSVGAALAQCQARGEVRELELAVLGGRMFAVCAARAGEAWLVDLTSAEVRVRDEIPEETLARMAEKLAVEGRHADVSQQHAFDAYYYPTHYRPDAVVPFVRIVAHDPQQTVYYLDPARARLLRRSTRLLRVERWLYNGLHSFDIAGLYEHRTLWRSLIVAAMVVGFVLSGLGGLLWLRRARRRRARRERDAQRASSASSPA